MAKKILALVSEPVSADALRSAVGDQDASDAEVLVVAPALNTRTRFLLSDPDPAIERAADVQEETVERLGEAGIDAAPTGTPGEADPLLALQDALTTYDADEIVLFTHPNSGANWLEDGLVDRAKERFSAPVRHVVIDGS
jgi:GABA permease